MLKRVYWVDCVAHANDTEPALTQLPYIGRVERIVKVMCGTDEYVLLKMRWFTTLMNAEHTGMLKDSSGMYIVNERRYMRSDRVTDKSLMLVSPKVEQVFLCDLPNAKAGCWLLVQMLGGRTWYTVKMEMIMPCRNR